MLKLLAQRLLGAIPVMLVLVLVVFVLREIAPVDQVVSLVGEKAPPEVYERVREELGLNDPLPTQYVTYLGDLAAATWDSPASPAGPSPRTSTSSSGRPWSSSCSRSCSSSRWACSWAWRRHRAGGAPECCGS